MAKLVLLFLLLATCTAHAQPAHAPLGLRQLYAQEVDRRLTLPDAEQHRYADLLMHALQQAGLPALEPQYILLVDRNPHVQAALLYWVVDGKLQELIGASPVSTGREGGREYFETPTGVYEHSIRNPDFRAEGTPNRAGILGYGIKGMRIFDFGWVNARKTWTTGTGEMRLLIHSTDPGQLEARLGTPQSKGCIRIPATLNRLLDQYGVLDADYDHALAAGRKLWVLDPRRHPSRWPGRYLVIIDSEHSTRPDWSPAP